jgi:hypothetical protein
VQEAVVETQKVASFSAQAYQEYKNKPTKRCLTYHIIREAVNNKT